MKIFEEKVACAIKFIESLTHTLSHDGEPFILLPFQKEWIRQIFGPIDDDGNQLINEVFLFLPKKNGKTELVAAIALFCLWGQGEERRGERIVMAASSAKQAALMFDAAATMIENDPDLSEEFEIFRSSRTIINARLNNRIVVTASDAKNVHGLNPSVVLADEISMWKGDKLYGALSKSMKTRGRKRLWISLSHAGYDQTTFAYKKFEYACKIKEGILENKHFLPILYYAKPDDDIGNESLWYATNPALGHFIDIQSFREEYQNAMLFPNEEQDFRMFSLNQWVGQAIRWIPMDKWKNCPTIEGEDPAERLKGRTCFAGLDMGGSADFTAFVIFWPPTEDDPLAYCLPFFWYPKEADPYNPDYLSWDKQGYIKLTEGDTAHQELIFDDICKLWEQYRFEKILIDPCKADWIAYRLNEEGITGEIYQPYMRTMAPPSFELERLVVTQKLVHNQHPVLYWMASNVHVIRDKEGRYRPSRLKGQEDAKVDGIIALVLAIAPTLGGDNGPSVYETRPIVFSD